MRDIIPENDTSLYDAVLYGVNTVKARADTDHINAVVILTDGQDTHSSATQQQVMDQLRVEGQGETSSVRVFTIAYGADAREDELTRVRRRLGRQGVPGQHRATSPRSTGRSPRSSSG